MTSVRVYLRQRPFNSREKALGNLEYPITLEEKVITIESRNKTYEFDRNFNHDATQADVFLVVGHRVCQDFIEGFNATQFVYGQTGAGKSWTMMGVKSDEELCGMIPRTSALLFDKIDEKPDGWEFIIEASYLEIYMERVNDLLDPDKQNLPVKEHKTDGVFVAGLTKESIHSVEQVLQIIDRGDSIRKVAATKMNAGSSRSHSVLSLYLTQTSPDKQTTTSQMNLVDLAGSERADKTGATGNTKKEGMLINLSLTTLSQVISGLSKAAGGGNVVVPYRQSKLTRLLQTSLGGNAKTGLSIHCSPHIDNLDESISTFEFGKRAKMIKNNAKQKVKKSVAQLEAELEKMTKLYEGLKVEYLKISGGTLPEGFGHAAAHGNVPHGAAAAAAGGGGVASSEEVQELQDKLKDLETEVQDGTMMQDQLKEEVEHLQTELAAKTHKLEEQAKDYDVKNLEVAALQSKLKELGQHEEEIDFGEEDMDDADAAANAALTTNTVGGIKGSNPKSNAQVAELRKLVKAQKDMLNRSRLEGKELKQENLELTDELEEKTRRLALAELQVMRYEHARNRVKNNKIKVTIKPNMGKQNLWKTLIPAKAGGDSKKVDYAKARKGTVLEKFGGLHPVPPDQLKGGRSGPLEERLYQKTKFVKRWFLLQDSFLLCYESEQASKTEPRFCIPLADSKIGSCPKQGDHEFCFMVLCGTYFNVMAASTEAEKSVWLKDLNEAKFVTHENLMCDAFFSRSAATAIADPTTQTAAISRSKGAAYAAVAEREYTSNTPVTGGMEGFLTTPGFKVIDKASMFSKELRKEWKPTYFVLNCSHLLLYDLENHSELITEPRGVMYMGHDTIKCLEQHEETDDPDNPDSGPATKFFFTVYNEADDGESLSLCASSASSRDAWITALKVARVVTFPNILIAALEKEEVCTQTGINGVENDLLGRPLDPLCVQPYDDSSKPLFRHPNGSLVDRDKEKVANEVKRFSKSGQPLDFFNRPLPQNAAPMFAKDPVEPVGVGIDGKHYAVPSFRCLDVTDPHYDFEGQPLHPETVKAADQILDSLKTACIVRSAVHSVGKMSYFDVFGRPVEVNRDGAFVTREGDTLPVGAQVYDAVGHPVKAKDMPAHVVKTIDIVYTNNDGELETIGKLGVEVGHTTLADLYAKIRSSITTKISTLVFLLNGSPVPEKEKRLRMASDFLPRVHVSIRDIHGKRMKWDGKVFIGDVNHEETDASIAKAKEDEFLKLITNQRNRKASRSASRSGKLSSSPRK